MITSLRFLRILSSAVPIFSGMWFSLTLPRLPAQNATWTGATSSAAANGANWQGALLPDGTRGAVFDAAVVSGSTTASFAAGDTATWQGINFLAGSTAFTLNLPTVGALTLGGGGIVNASTGSQTVSAGNLALASSAPLTQNATGSLAIGASIALGSNTLTLDGNGAGLATVSGAISGGGAVTKSGTGTWTLAGANSYSGGTTVNAGTLVGNTTSLKGNITNNAAITFNQTTSATYAGTISGTGALTKTGSGALTLTGASTYAGGTTIAGGTLNLGTGGSLAGNVVVNAGSILSFGASGVVTFGGVISGAGELSKSLVGTLTLTATNTYSGPTRVTRGTVDLSGPTGQLTGTSLVSVGLGGTFNAGDTAALNGVVNRINPGASLQMSGVTSTGSGGGTSTFNLLRGSSTAGDQAFTFLVVGGNGASAITGGASTNGPKPTLTFSNGGPYVRSVGGSLDISNANLNVVFTNAPPGSAAGVGSDAILIGATLNGVDFIAAAAGVVSAPPSLYTATGTTAWTAGKNMDVTGSNGAPYTAVEVNSVRFNANGANTVTLADGTNSVASGMILVTDAVGANVSTIAGSGGGSILMGRAAQDLLVINNNTSGALVIGSIIADNAGATGLTKSGAGILTLTGANTYSGITTINTGTLQLGAGNALSSATAVAVVAGATFDVNGKVATVRSIAGDGSITLGSGTLTTSGTNSTTFVGVISGNGGAFTKTGSGTLTLSGTNTYTGGTTIGGGTLQIGSGGTTGSITGDVTNGGILNFNRSNDLTFSGVISGNGALTKSGAGTLTLSGTNTYTGGTTISAGTLLVNSSLLSSFVTVASGATLGGSGAISGATTVSSGGHIAPGNSAGTLVFVNGLTLLSGTVLDFQLGTSSDRINLTGGILVGPAGTGGITLNLSDAGGFSPGVRYTLFDFVSGQTSSFDVADFSLGTLIGGTTAGDFSFDLTAASLGLTYQASAIPEPSTYAALTGLGALALAMWRRHYRRRTSARVLRTQGASRTMFLLPGLLAVASGMLIQPPSYGQSSFSVLDLGIPGGGSSSAANAINNAGQIVGTSNNSPLFPAWIYSNGSATVVAANASAYGVGPAGQVLGSVNNHAFVYANGTTTDLGTLGGVASTAVAMNAAGQIVGTSFTAGFQNHAFSYANGTMSDLGTLGGASSFAGGINAAGTIVGVSRTAGGVPHAFAYANGVMTDLGTLGGTESHGNGINDVGQIVGYSMITGGQTRAFLWANGTMTNLGALGGTDSYGYGINAAGQIVGELVLSGGVSHAMYYTGGQMYDLNALTNLSGSGLTRLDWATAINDSGQIVGIGTATDGSQHGFLLTAIPEPSTYAALAGLGALGLAVGVRV